VSCDLTSCDFVEIVGSVRQVAHIGVGLLPDLVGGAARETLPRSRAAASVSSTIRLG
jgi:hypothetical protein